MDSTGSFRFWENVTMDLTMLAAFGSRRQPARPVVRLVKREMPRVPGEIPLDLRSYCATLGTGSHITWIVDPEARSIEAYVLSGGVFRVAVRVAGADPV